MELVPPGTEEEVAHSPAQSKKSTEHDRLLSIQAYLSEIGRYGNVFELNYINGSEQWYCKLCKCPVMGRVYHHENGKRHTLNMAGAVKHGNILGSTHKDEPYKAKEKFGKREVEQSKLKIAPGEPVPPGFESELVKVAQIQERLDAFHSGSLLGLEYLLEIQDYDHDKEPSYQCLLCGKRGDPRTVLSHLVSYNHIQGYLQRHFPKTYQALAPFMTRQFKKNWQDAINKIAEAIETKYGRLLPHPVDSETFNTGKEQLYQMVHLGPHFSEKNGVTFENLINQEELTRVTEEDVNNETNAGNEDACKMETVPGEKPKKRSPSPPVVQKPKRPRPSGLIERKKLSSVSSISSSDLSDFDDGKKKQVKESNPPRQPVYERRRSRSPRYNRPRYERREPSPRRRRPDAMPWNRPDYVRNRKDTSNEPRNKSRDDKRSEPRNKARDDKMSEFRKLSVAIENDMEKTLRQHKANPERHPRYNEEWKLFWNKRYNELQTEGEDPSKHDFKPEWIVYWNKHMEDVHKADVKVKIEALRKRLGLVTSEPTPINFKIGKRKGGAPVSDAKVTPTAAQVETDVIVIDDKEDSPGRSRSPWESEPRAKRSLPRDTRDRYQRWSRDRSLDRNRDRSMDRNRDRSMDRNRDRSMDRNRDRSMDRNRDRSLDRSNRGRSKDRSIRDRSIDRSNRDRSMNRDRSPNRRDFCSREQSWERDIGYHRESRKDPTEYYKPPPVMRDVTRNPVDYIPTEPEDDGEINIVAVLRLLTALEDKLGSLGPKVIDMLANALAMEKKEPNSSETLLDNEINCVLFETVKEKLKGALHAGLVFYSQEKAYKNAIKKIAGLLHLASTRSMEKSKAASSTSGASVDKAAIAKQIATALVLQGKTDVTQAELEQLINAVVGMAEASKNSAKPVTTATFLQSLASKQPEEPEPVETPPPDPVVITPTPSIPRRDTSPTKETPLDGLSDSDLQTLLQNFKDLSTEEQHGLITYLKKLEAKEPERVEKLRKFVNIDKPDEPVEKLRKFVNIDKPDEPVKEPTGRISPFSRKLIDFDLQNPTTAQSTFEEFADDAKSDDHDEDYDESKFDDFSAPAEIKPVVKSMFPIDSEEEDYSYDDVFKAADKNVKDSKQEKERKIIEDTIKRDSKIEADVLTDAKALIANIMGSIASKSNSSSNSVDSPVSEDPKQTIQIKLQPQPGTSVLQNPLATPLLQKPPQLGFQPTNNPPAPYQQQQNNQPAPYQQPQNKPSAPYQQQQPPQNNQPTPYQQQQPQGNQPAPYQQPHNNMNYPRMPHNQPPQRGGFNNQNVGYPNMNNPYGGNFQNNYKNNFNYPNQFNKQNNRFNHPRGQFNSNNRGGGNFNNRW